MGNKSRAPAAPDYSGVAAANAESARYSFKLGKEQLQWAKDTYASDKEVTDKVVNAALATQQTNDATAAKDRERYETTFQPIEDKFAQNAIDMSSPARSDANAARAMGDVSQQFEQARQNARQQLEAYGVDPSQTRAAALDLSTRTQEAAARASAGNTSRFQTEGQANAMLGSAIDIGKGYPASIAQQYGTGTAAGGQAAGVTNAATATGASTMGTSAQYTGLGLQGLSGQSSALTAGYNAQLGRFNAQQQQSSGIGSLLGTAVGLGIRGRSAGLFEEGGLVPEAEDMQEYQDDPTLHTGISVTKDMSPSRGIMTDDVPARLNAGEFVVPDDVTRWLGEKHMQNLVQKSREEKQQAVAKPTLTGIKTERPVVSTARGINTGA